MGKIYAGYADITFFNEKDRYGKKYGKTIAFNGTSCSGSRIIGLLYNIKGKLTVCS